MPTSILYSFRRCPYAMRARLAIATSDISVQLREVVLKDKPSELLTLSPKATVPVLLTEDELLIDESIDIMYWAWRQSDPQQCLDSLNEQQHSLTKELIAQNDGEFKSSLDRYKYADRYPEHSQDYYRQQAEIFLQKLELQLTANDYLLGSQLTLADLAILPFIRQFAFVDKAWFDASPYPKLQHWLELFIQSELFELIMHKYPQWQSGDIETYFP
ncbi:MAG: glutathione S-transferase [Gammaproteobacteria bacterium]|nr:MAG: glutathione S-transferase [Gammaproteobacteria bacterium]